MPVFLRMPVCAAVAVMLWAVATAFAQGEIKYDPDKGIMFVDDKIAAGKVAKPQMSLPRVRDSNDIQEGRKKDPPTLYFISGQEYYQNGDFTHALQNFRYADSVSPKPVYKLWVGKTLRSLGQPDRMLAVMEGIVKKYPDCEVADDALLEMAVHYQNSDDYETATHLYSQIAEQYPFAVSYTSGESLIEVVRQQRKQLSAQLNTMLAIMGYMSEDLSVNIAGFQKSNRLAETGLADKPTVQMIKKMHARLLERDLRRDREAAAAKKHLRFVVVAGVIGTLNILIAIIILFQARSRRRQISFLGENLSDLDVRKL